jgi:two-component system sensor histidine kinase/response regulator
MSSAPLARLLIVDDERNLVTALCRTLEAEGYSTTGVASGLEALNALRGAMADDATKFEVLITDLMMPFMDGIALLREAHGIDRDLVSIVMTGHGTIDSAVDAMKGGALDYILKPFNLSVAIPVLLRALAVRRLRRENAALQQQVANRTAELETANRELQGANKELEAFAYSVSHDLRQPLNHIIGFSEFLISEKPGMLNEKQREFLGDIYNGGTRLLRLTEDLLEFSRLSQQALKKQAVNIEGLVWEILRAMQAEEPQRNVELHVGPLPAALADPSLLRQALVNVLANAFKFTRRASSPRIEVTGKLLSGKTIYRISDNGAGFDMADAPRLFSIFQRLHSDGEFEGTGVGLSIVQRIIERHGGTVSAKAAVGKGAAFTLALPT